MTIKQNCFWSNAKNSMTEMKCWTNINQHLEWASLKSSVSHSEWAIGHERSAAPIRRMEPSSLSSRRSWKRNEWYSHSMSLQVCSTSSTRNRLNTSRNGVRSSCIGGCALDPQTASYCIRCYRSISALSHWMDASDDQRRVFLKEAKQNRKIVKERNHTNAQ